MGEPLLYGQFDEILDLCEEFGLKLNLTTNGTFPGRTATEWAHRIVPLASDVKISWNGATQVTAEAIMTGIRWERVLQNVKDFIRVRDEYARQGRPACRVTFQLTFLETNVAELADIVKLASSLGVDRVKGHHVWTHYEPLEALSMRRSPEAIARWNEAVRAAREASDRYRLPSGAPVLLDNIFELEAKDGGEIASLATCPFLGKEAWVSAEGKFSPCCAPGELRKSLGDFGSLSERSLHTIWTSPEYERLRATYRSHSLCRSCNMRKVEGAC